MDNESRGEIYVAGHRGLVGSAIVRALERAGCKNLIYGPTPTWTSPIRRRLGNSSHRTPRYVFLAAAKVGGSWRTASIQQSSSFRTFNAIECD